MTDGAATGIRLTAADKVFMTFTYVALTLFFLLVLYPLVYVVSASFSSSVAVVTGRVFLWPVEPSLAGYAAVFRNRQVLLGYANSLYYTVAGTSINLAVTLLCAYPLSRKDFWGRGFFMAVFTFTMFFSGGLIPSFLLVRSLGMYNTRWALLIPGAMSVWNMIIARTYFQASIPTELLEASQMDGCSDIRFLLKVAIPLSGPIIAVLALWYAIGHWNSYFSALIYLRRARLFPLQIILRNILIQNQIDPTMISNIDYEREASLEGLRELLKYSLIVVASVPMIALYPFAQRYFVRGVMIGAIKG